MATRALPETTPRGLSPADVAAALAVDRKTVYRMIERGELIAVRIGPRNLRIPTTEVVRLLEPAKPRRPRKGQRDEVATKRRARVNGK